MNNKKIFIIIPSFAPESPVKGAIALANKLVETHYVNLITLKKDNNNRTQFNLNSKVEHISLGEEGLWINRFLKLRKILKTYGYRDKVITISYCLSADCFNSFCNNFATTFSSVRGNLPIAYQTKYWKFGHLLAYLHLKILKRINYVISMTESMSIMVEEHIKNVSPVIGNFIDEKPLEKFRRKSINEGNYKFIFVGSLDKNKQPKILLKAMEEILNKKINATLDIFGEGPLMLKLQSEVRNKKLSHLINFYGFILDPFSQISQADVMVIPSFSEGISRSALEALYLGIPCVMRDIDGNSELITNGINGELFSDISNLSNKMLEAAKYSRQNSLFEKSLVPKSFQQDFASKKFIKIIENN